MLVNDHILSIIKLKKEKVASSYQYIFSLYFWKVDITYSISIQSIYLCIYNQEKKSLSWIYCVCMLSMNTLIACTKKKLEAIQQRKRMMPQNSKYNELFIHRNWDYSTICVQLTNVTAQLKYSMAAWIINKVAHDATFWNDMFNIYIMTQVFFLIQDIYCC